MEATATKGLQAFKRLPFAANEQPLTKGVQELYVCDGKNTILYRYEDGAKGIEIRQIETFPVGYLQLMRKNSQNQFYPVGTIELKDIWNAECAMITRQRNKLRAALNSSF